MKWFKDENFTVKELEDELGIKIKSLLRGSIPTGEFIDSFDDITNEAIKIPVTRQGIEIEFALEPTAEQLKALDLKLGLRDGGHSIFKEISDLKAKTAALEGKVILK